MAAPKVMSGARATFGVFNPNTDTTTVIGIFSNVSYGVTYDVQPAFILGRYSAAEIDYTAADVVQVTASGWRVIGNGWHKAGQLPTLQQLLTHEYLQLSVTDRQTNKVIAVINNVRPTSASGGFAARQLSESTHTFVGLLVDDEDNQNSESVGAADLP